MEKQLDLFEGVMLTQEQEQMVTEFIADKEKRATREFEENRLVQKMLVDAGFKQGKDFKNTFETVVVTADEIELGSYYRDNQFTAKDITYVNTKGGITLLSQRYDTEEDKVVERGISYFNREGNKFECSSLTGSYRKVKPTTLLEKLQAQRIQAEYQMKAVRRDKMAFTNAIEDLKEKFPSASVFAFDDYDSYGRNYRNVKRIKAEFPNGSYVTFNVGLDGNYRMANRVDAALKGMDMMQTLEFFANQNK